MPPYSETACCQPFRSAGFSSPWISASTAAPPRSPEQDRARESRAAEPQELPAVHPPEGMFRTHIPPSCAPERRPRLGVRNFSGRAAARERANTYGLGRDLPLQETSAVFAHIMYHVRGKLKGSTT